MSAQNIGFDEFFINFSFSRDNWTDSGISVTANSLASNAHWIHLEEEEVEEEELFGWKLQLSRDSNCAFQTFHLRQNFWDCRLTANAAIVYYQICQWTTESGGGGSILYTQFREETELPFYLLLRLPQWVRRWKKDCHFRIIILRFFLKHEILKNQWCFFEEKNWAQQSQRSL